MREAWGNVGELTRLSLSDMGRAVQDGSVSAQQLVTCHIERSIALQPALNAYTLLDGDTAIARAQELDASMAAGHRLGPLAGVPLGVKDLIDQAGAVTTCGSSFYRAIAQESAPVVERLETAGGVFLGRTGLHEFAFGYSSENPWWGPVRNPWDVGTSPGGSSGGSAAAVAAGMVAGAIGTDTGGSVRVPAALCGIVGLKVTHGRIPLRGVFPLAPSLDSVGPLARSVEDATLLYEAMAGYDPADPRSAPVGVEGRGTGMKLRGLKIGIPTPWIDNSPVTANVRAAFQHAVDALANLAVDVRLIDASILDPRTSRVSTILRGEAAVVHRPWFPERAEYYGTDLIEPLNDGLAVSMREYLEAQTWRAHLRNTVGAIFAEVDFLLTPAAAVTVLPIGQGTAEIDGSHHAHRQLFHPLASVVNCMENPALVLPLAGAGDPPPALQIVGPMWSESRLLALGRFLEEVNLARVRSPPLW